MTEWSGCEGERMEGCTKWTTCVVFITAHVSAYRIFSVRIHFFDLHTWNNVRWLFPLVFVGVYYTLCKRIVFVCEFFFFQFCFIFIMGSTKGNTIAILFDTSMVSFGFDMASARTYTRVYLYGVVHAGVVYFDKATSDRRKHTMTIIQNVKTKLIILFVWFFVQFWFQLCVHGHKSSEPFDMSVWYDIFEYLECFTVESSWKLKRTHIQSIFMTWTTVQYIFQHTQR